MKTTPYFYNTNQTTGETLINEIDAAKSLEEKVLKFFEKHPKRAFNWCEVMQQIGFIVNESSLKRAITNLKTKEHLLKTQDLAKTIYGKSAHRYIINFTKNVNNLE